MQKKFMLGLAGMLLALNLTCSANGPYNEEVFVQVGIPLEFNDASIIGYDYDSENVVLEMVNGALVPTTTKVGDTVITVKYRNSYSPARVLVHALTMNRYERIIDDNGNLKPQFRNNIYGTPEPGPNYNPGYKPPMNRQPINHGPSYRPTAPSYGQMHNPPAVDRFAQDVLQLVNRERARYGAAPLHLAADLQRETAIRAEECSRVFSHTRPNGRDCFSIMSNRGRTCAENIAAGNSTPQEVVDQWMNSSGHRANILNPAFKELGVGYVEVPGTEYTHYWVQLFRG